MFPRKRDDIVRWSYTMCKTTLTPANLFKMTNPRVSKNVVGYILCCDLVAVFPGLHLTHREHDFLGQTPTQTSSLFPGHEIQSLRNTRQSFQRGEIHAGPVEKGPHHVAVPGQMVHIWVRRTGSLGRENHILASRFPFIPPPLQIRPMDLGFCVKQTDRGVVQFFPQPPSALRIDLRLCADELISHEIHRILRTMQHLHAHGLRNSYVFNDLRPIVFVPTFVILTSSGELRPQHPHDAPVVRLGLTDKVKTLDLGLLRGRETEGDERDRTLLFEEIRSVYHVGREDVQLMGQELGWWKIFL